MYAQLLRKALPVTLAAVLAAACTGGGEGDAGDTPSAPSTEKVTLTFWSWAPEIGKVVDLWNKRNPNIQVKHTNPAQGDDLLPKLIAANKAGNPPDLFQAEYQALPVLITSGVAGDITRHVAPVRSAYTASAWKQVQFGTSTYALPQDFAPMMLYYRADLFEKNGIKVPTTWAEYAEAAERIKEVDEDASITTFSANDPGWFAGLAEQAGARWWSTSGKSWTVGINDPATQRVANYWGDLVSRDLVQGTPMYTPEWNRQLTDGTLWTWPSAVWGPAVLEGVAGSTKGKWKMAPLPAWTAGDRRVGFWGGSSTAIAAKSKHQVQAAEFARWLNTDPAALEALVTESAVYPAAIKGQSVPGLAKAPAFMPGQPDFYRTVQQISRQTVPVTWGPNVNVTYNAYRDAFAKAARDKSAFGPPLATMRQATIADMRRSGFTVAGP